MFTAMIVRVNILKKSFTVDIICQTALFAFANFNAR